ncbi:MAG: PilZ domain-containing protein [Deltaproteobacteria bacterium]|nr:PilZ domain-containing protein [Deltaproteobacteria bacterium]
MTTPAKKKYMRKNYAPDGRYMPIGGGSRGWRNNDLIAINEKHCGYKYSRELEQPVSVFHEIPDIEVKETRNSPRYAVDLRILWTDSHSENERPGYCMELSETGMQVRLREAVEKEEVLSLKLVARRSEHDEPEELFTISGKVVWVKMASGFRGQVRYDCGIHFKKIDNDLAEKMKMIMAGRIMELLPSMQEEGEAEEEPENQPPPTRSTLKVAHPRSIQPQSPEQAPAAAPEPDVYDDGLSEL